MYEEPDNDVRVEAANMIADMLAVAGIEATPTTVTLTEMSERLSAGSFDLALVAYAMDVCPDPGFILIRGNMGNYCRYRSDNMTELCNTLRKQTTQADYQNVLYQMQQQFVDDCPFLCLYYRAGAVLTRKIHDRPQRPRTGAPFSRVGGAGGAFLRRPPPPSSPKGRSSELSEKPEESKNKRKNIRKKEKKEAKG